MATEGKAWEAIGSAPFTSSSSATDPISAPSSLEARFFTDDGLWRTAPILTGQGSFAPNPDVHNILVTGGEGFMYKRSSHI